MRKKFYFNAENENKKQNYDRILYRKNTFNKSN